MIETLADLDQTYQAAKRAMIVRQRDRGLTMREAAAVLGTSPASICNYCHKHGVTWARRKNTGATTGERNANAKLTARHG